MAAAAHGAYQFNRTTKWAQSQNKNAHFFSYLTRISSLKLALNCGKMA
uniref:Uncharacterized protein n=1 Tax=Anguilla anguilla TaxID=7936 RepID=A0A0E9RPR5_ANGAN